MGLFGKVVGLAVNVALLPVAIVKDVVSSPLCMTRDWESATRAQLEKIAKDANDE